MPLRLVVSREEVEPLRKELAERIQRRLGGYVGQIMTPGIGVRMFAESVCEGYLFVADKVDQGHKAEPFPEQYDESIRDQVATEMLFVVKDKKDETGTTQADSPGPKGSSEQ